MYMAIGIANEDEPKLLEPSRDRGKVVLQVDGLRKRYGAIEAVKGVSFDVRQGEVFGLLGLNGAGKTSLISMLATSREPSGGDALLLGHSISKEPRAIRHMIGVAPQENALYPSLTAAENLRFFGRMYDVPASELRNRIEEVLRFVDLQDRANDLVGTYSGGMKRRANLAAALVHQPQLILMDEPTAGVDPQSREEILALVHRLRDEGKSILYTTHYMEEAQGLCDELGILDEGELVAIGTLDAVLRDIDFPEIIELKGLSPNADLSAIEGLQGIGHIERHNGTARLFVKRATDFLEPLHQIICSENSAYLTITPISLENLFLHLTGRKAHAGKRILK
jgi:ABC-2 type transport system ATP-binding protein